MRIEPEVAVRDLHPGYLSTRIAAELGCARTIAVQHHHAHIAAVLAEHGETGPAVGVAFDGAGFGDDGTVWGSEFLVADLAGYRRCGHLRAAPLPGGDLAARKPWRSALGYLSLAPELAVEFSAAFAGVQPAERVVAELQIGKRINAPLASSMGRLFDAAAAVLGLRSDASFEGQAAMELEALAGNRPARIVPVPVHLVSDEWLIDPLPLLGWLGAEYGAGANRADLAADFHDSIAAVTADVIERIASAEGLDIVALGGGSFQNSRLLAGVLERLWARGLTALVPRRLPPNDGAISFGQAASAAALLARES
jgi:hydrogenase maturation protein HypF